MHYPPVVIVDEQDRVIGEAPLAEARARGLIYRVVFVMAEDPSGRFLVQQRGSTMQLYPNCWDVSAGGHVDDGHGYEEAARLELLEEIGVRGARLTEVGHYYTDEPLWGGIPSRRYVKIYRTRLKALPPHRANEEVAKVRWLSPVELRQLAAEHPERLAEGLAAALRHLGITPEGA